MQSFFCTFTSTKSHRQTDVTSILWETGVPLTSTSALEMPAKQPDIPANRSRSQRRGKPPSATQEPSQRREKGEPNHRLRAVFGKEKHDANHTFDGTSIARDHRVMEARRIRWRWRADLRFVLFRETQLDAREVHAMLQCLLFRFHLLDFTTHTGDLLFHGKHIADLAGPLQED